MESVNKYEAGIIGGGLAGLACSIELAKKGRKVILFEKEKYPFHKVCGEYVSNESRDFLEESGLPIEELCLPPIDTLMLTAPGGKSFTTRLPLGGFGISRYLLDEKLAAIAKSSGVIISENSKVSQVRFEDGFNITANSESHYTGICCGAFGKHSNLDVKWKRDFLNAHDKRLDNFVAVKYHVKTDWPSNVIGLHNFQNGYCGISRIENEQYCLCYMTRAAELKKYKGNIELMEKNLLWKNPFLKNIFSNAEIAEGFPVTISQINFNRKQQVEDHVLMLGDAAGMIAPLCGNGMSMAMHAGKMAAILIDEFLKGNISRKELETRYVKQWQQHFSSRLRTGRVLQRFFGSARLSSFFVQTFKTLPFLAGPLVKMTHGRSF
jgi:flavin-dependent dehydrogenase